LKFASRVRAVEIGSAQTHVEVIQARSSSIPTPAAALGDLPEENGQEPVNMTAEPITPAVPVATKTDVADRHTRISKVIPKSGMQSPALPKRSLSATRSKP